MYKIRGAAVEKSSAVQSYARCTTGAETHIKKELRIKKTKIKQKMEEEGGGGRRRRKTEMYQ